jgi:hypothetical protein
VHHGQLFFVQSPFDELALKIRKITSKQPLISPYVVAMRGQASGFQVDNGRPPLNVSER